MDALPRPGVVGRLVRVVLGAGVVLTVASLATDLRPMLSGDLPLGDPSFWVMAFLVVSVTPWVVDELLRVRWRWRSSLVGVALLALAALADVAIDAALSGSLVGIVGWTWAFVFSAVLGGALLLAAVLGTPGCEMRAFAHLAATLRGRDARLVACPGWLDRLDGVRVRRR